MLTAKLKAKESNTEWRVQLNLEFSKSNNRTILSQRKHFGPCMYRNPFTQNLTGPVIYTFYIHRVEWLGGHLNICVDVKPNAHALITTPAAGKFYLSAGPIAKQQQNQTHILTLTHLSALRSFIGSSENVVICLR
tara:strand:- start:79 stop:483 length:405 start_codon:yes stop_codon:yes gene_type:complete